MRRQRHLEPQGPAGPTAVVQSRGGLLLPPRGRGQESRPAADGRDFPAGIDRSVDGRPCRGCIGYYYTIAYRLASPHHRCFLTTGALRSSTYYQWHQLSTSRRSDSPAPSLSCTGPCCALARSPATPWPARLGWLAPTSTQPWRGWWDGRLRP